jgi:FAD/FMN-containing dehydrogenase
MGLTGIILDLTFTLNRIETGWLKQTTHVAPNLESALQVLGSVSASTYSVAWIDCLARGASLGRSLIFAAEHATPNELRSSRQEFPKRRASRLSVPFDLPEFTLNRASIRAFNELYYRVGAAKAKTPQLVQWDPYFFPLDAIGSWNRIYGRRGFVQYQCVIPTARAVEVLTEILERVSTRSSASFLAVLKQLRAGRGFLSFPLEGYTLALDLAVDEKVFFLLDELDRLVVAAGGRLYLAKDARQSAATFEASYPDLDRFRDLRRAIGAERHMSSFMSNRLGMR